MSIIPKMKINSGYEIPMTGLGTWLSKPGEVAEAVKTAISAGYRHIDCAFLYCNERDVGYGIRLAIEQGLVKREELFITSKLWCACFRKDVVRHSLKKTLEDLSLDYLDLYLIHGPVSMKDCEPGHLTAEVPIDSEGNLIFSDVHFMEAWTVLEDCASEGIVRSIGISNFNSVQVQEVLDKGKIKPAVNQIECHPYLNQSRLVEFCAERSIVITAYCPLGNMNSTRRKPGDPIVLQDPELVRIAAKYKKTPAQIALRFNFQRNIVVIPKTVTPSRMKENIEILDFSLTEEDMECILGLDRNYRVLPFDSGVNHPQFPFRDDVP